MIFEAKMHLRSLSIFNYEKSKQHTGKYKLNRACKGCELTNLLWGSTTAEKYQRLRNTTVIVVLGGLLQTAI